MMGDAAPGRCRSLKTIGGGKEIDVVVGVTTQRVKQEELNM